MTRLVAMVSVLALSTWVGCSARISPPVAIVRQPWSTAAAPSAEAVVSEGPVSEGQVVEGQVIEAGCTFNASQIKGVPGSMHRVACPANCRETGTTWGTDVYTADSPICRAAIHAGLVNDRGGEVTVVLEPGKPAYRGTARNGIQSSDYGSYRASYRLRR